MEKLHQGTTPHHVHQQTDESLRANEERFRALADAVPAIVWTATPDGTITFANEQWFQYCGLTPEQNARHWLEFVVHPDDRQRCLTAWSQALAYGSRYEIEVRNRRHDGVYRWFLTRALPVRDTAGRITEWYGTTTDIHDRKQAEEQLQHKTEDLADSMWNWNGAMRSSRPLRPSSRTTLKSHCAAFVTMPTSCWRIIRTRSIRKA